MNRKFIYTYNNVEEFNKLSKNLKRKQQQIFPFSITLENNVDLFSEKTIDISLVVEFIKITPNNSYLLLSNLEKLLSNEAIIIIRADLSQFVLETFSVLFYKAKPLYKNSESIVKSRRKQVYAYTNTEQLNKVINYLEEQEKNCFSLGELIFDIDSYEKVECTIDLSSICNMIKNNKAQICLVEKALKKFDDAVWIVLEQYAKDVLENFPYFFYCAKRLEEMYNQVELESEGSGIMTYVKKVRSIVDLSKTDIYNFEKQFCEKIIGHNNFKKEFFKKVRNFLVLNKIGRKKVFSIFLLGNPGLGKTEVARQMHSFFDSQSPIVKINFGNYSSQDALNNLIDSPAGYVRSNEDAELVKKIEKSGAGVVLCDEFEKATESVYNFFLELLEDGKFTDARANEYNLNGYVIVFTTNVRTRKELYEKIPAELLSRLDIISIFYSLNYEEKLTYVKNIYSQYKKDILLQYPETILSDIEIDDNVLKNTNDLREIKRVVEQKIVEKLFEKII